MKKNPTLFMGDGINDAPALTAETVEIALESAIGGMVLSVIGMGFAAEGFLSPVAGAITQEIIDIIAIINSLQLIWRNNIETDI